MFARSLPPLPGLRTILLALSVCAATATVFEAHTAWFCLFFLGAAAGVRHAVSQDDGLAQIGAMSLGWPLLVMLPGRAAQISVSFGAATTSIMLLVLLIGRRWVWAATVFFFHAAWLGFLYVYAS